MIGFAFLVDAAVYAVLGTLAVWLGKRHLPTPWNQPAFTIPLVVSIGLVLSLASYPHWLLRFD
jgi:hypothetical protein